jgi:hypothetical protein
MDVSFAVMKEAIMDYADKHPSSMQLSGAAGRLEDIQGPGAFLGMSMGGQQRPGTAPKGGQAAEERENRGGDQQGPRRTVICYACREPGHIQAYCTASEEKKTAYRASLEEEARGNEAVQKEEGDSEEEVAIGDGGNSERGGFSYGGSAVPRGPVSVAVNG